MYTTDVWEQQVMKKGGVIHPRARLASRRVSFAVDVYIPLLLSCIFLAVDAYTPWTYIPHPTPHICAFHITHPTYLPKLE